MICRKTSIRLCNSVMIMALLMSLLIGSVSAEAPAEQWKKTYGEDLHVSGIAKQTSDGGYVFPIIYGGKINQTIKSYIIKTDTKGDKEWMKLVETVFDSRTVYPMVWDIQPTVDGGYVFLEDGQKLIKTDSIGNEKWSTNTEGDFRTIHQTTDNGYILAGAEATTIMIMKTDANGKKEWVKSFSSAIKSMSNNCYYMQSLGVSVSQTSDGGYILAGCKNTIVNNRDNEDAWLIKIDANGNEKWNKTYGGEGLDIAFSAQQTSDGGYVFSGSTAFSDFIDPASDVDLYSWLVKVDANGEKQWNKTFVKSSASYAKYVQQTSDGGYIIQSHAVDVTAGTTSIKTDNNGNVIWSELFGGKKTETGYSISEGAQQTSDRGYIILDSEEGLIKLNPDNRIAKVVDTTKDNLPDIEKPAEKSTPGFETIFSIVALSLLKRKKT